MSKRPPPDHSVAGVHTETFYKALGQHLKKAREDAGLTQGDIADMTGLNRVTINYIEHGHRWPQIHTVHAYCHQLDIDPWDMLRTVADAVRTPEPEPERG